MWLICCVFCNAKFITKSEKCKIRKVFAPNGGEKKYKQIDKRVQGHTNKANPPWGMYSTFCVLYPLNIP